MSKKKRKNNIGIGEFFIFAVFEERLSFTEVLGTVISSSYLLSERLNYGYHHETNH